MEENTNRTIVVNTFLLYIKLGVSIICGLFSTRFSFQALGIVDFGLYSVIGGIVAFISIINTIMVSSSNRFMAVAIGRKDTEAIKEQFNVNVVIHIGIMILTILVALPVGYWYIVQFLNYEGQISTALWVYVISLMASTVTFYGVPYNGLLMAKENFPVICVADIISYILKLTLTYLLLFTFKNKILAYAVIMAVVTVLPTVIYIVYCRKEYPFVANFCFVRNKEKYKEVFSFSSWVSIGAISLVGKSQGVGIIVNMFYNTVMNTAVGIANSINSYIMLFSNSIVQPIQPQITKSFSIGDMKRVEQLLVMSTKYSFMAMYLISVPFFVACSWILSLWLGDVPPYSELFVILLVIDTLVQSFNSGVANVIFASGNIKAYQICVSVLNLLPVVLGYYTLKLGFPVYCIFVVSILCSAIRFVVIQVVLSRTISVDKWLLTKKAYLPSIFVVLASIPSLLIPTNIHPFVKIGISLLLTIVLMFYIGLDKNEKQYVINHFFRISRN